jgi:hypothetical protein
MIWLEASVLRVDGTLDASGGTVKPLDSGAGLNAAGGTGADGRIQLSSPDLMTAGTITPAVGLMRMDDPVCD